MAIDSIYRQGRTLPRETNGEPLPKTWISLGDAALRAVEQAALRKKENESKAATRAARNLRGAP